jgi:hypothetical protein
MKGSGASTPDESHSLLEVASMTLPLSPSYRQIPLSKGQTAIVDETDFDWLMGWKWHAKWAVSTQSYYAARVECRPGKSPLCVRMHRQILGLVAGDQLHSDHINRDTLDNRRCNLRSVTQGDNNINQGMRKDNRSGFRGVCWYKASAKWRAYIGVGGRQKYLGSFVEMDDAIRAYRDAESIHYLGIRPLHDPSTP